jgi:RHS repeat-associated protein
VSSFGESANSNQASATPHIPPPPAPTNLTAYAGNTFVTLTWNQSSSATSYDILRSLTSGGPYSTIQTGVTTSSYVDTGLTNGTTYYYVVTASNAGGTSGDSNQANATPTSGQYPLQIIPNPPLGFLPNPLTLPSWEEDTIPTDTSDAPGGGPASVFSVNLPYGVVDVNIGPALVMYDPNVGNIDFTVSYRTALAQGNISSPGLPAGWTHNWDYRLVPLQVGSWGSLQFVYPNGGSEAIKPVLDGNGSPTGAFTALVGAPYVATGVPDPNTPGLWDSITLSHNGLAQEVFQIPSADIVYRLVTSTVENGASINLSYSSGQLTNLQSSNPSGGLSNSHVYLIYSGGLLQYANGGDNQLRFGYNSTNELSTVYNQADGTHLWDFNYEAIGNGQFLSQANTYETRSATVAYDPATGRAVSVTDGNCRIHSYSYLNGSTQVAIGPPSSPTDLFTNAYDSIGRLLSTTDAAGNTGTLSYSGYDPSALSTVVEPSSAVLTISRDDHGNPTLYQYPDGTKLSLGWQYPAGFHFGQLQQTQEIGSDGTTKTPTTYSYYTTTNWNTGAEAGYVSSVTYPLGATDFYTYTSLGDVATVTTQAADGSPAITTYNYLIQSLPQYQEQLDEPMSVTDPMQQTTQYGYSPDGWAYTSDPLGNVVSGTFNQYGQLTQLALPTAPNEFYNPVYGDGQGKDPSITGFSLVGGGGANVENVTHDGEYGASQIWGGTVFGTLGITTDNEYGLSVLTNGNSQPMHQFAPDHFQNSLTYQIGTGGGSAAWTQQFNANGSLYSVTGPLATAVVSRTAADLPTNIHYTSSDGNSGADINYQYDGFGRVVRSASDGAAHTYTYDAEDHVLTDTLSGAGFGSTLTYTYAPNGLRMSMTIAPNGQFPVTYNYTYNKDGYLTNINAGSGATVEYDYDADNRVWAVRTPQATTIYNYDSIGRIVALKNLTPDGDEDDPTTYVQDPINNTAHSTYSSFTSPQYDSLNNLLGASFEIRGLLGNTQNDLNKTFTYSTGNVGYTYGDGNALTQENWTLTSNKPGFPDNSQIIYSNDDGGNLTSLRGYSLGINPQTDQIVSRGSCPAYAGVQYDANGDVTNFRGITAAYDLLGQLWEITPPVGSSSLVAYDEDGHRVERGNSTYAYDGDELVNPDFSTARGLLGPVTTFTYDPSGNTVYRIGAYGKDLPELYDGYGEPVWPQYDEPPSTADFVGECFRYKGQAGCYTDTDTDLIYCQHRYYDSIAGRWITRDPIGLEGGINSYEYCDDNPMLGADPSGEELLANRMMLAQRTTYPEAYARCDELNKLYHDPRRRFPLEQRFFYYVDSRGVICDNMAGAPSPEEHERYLRKQAYIMGAAMGTIKRRSSASLRREWEEIYGRKWPRAPDGTLYEVNHVLPLADGGYDNGWNVEPMSQYMHRLLHSSRGDFARWAARQKDIEESASDDQH